MPLAVDAAIAMLPVPGLAGEEYWMQYLVVVVGFELILLAGICVFLAFVGVWMKQGRSRLHKEK